MIAVGALVMAGGALISSQAALRLSDRQPVVVMARDVPVGQQISAADLTTVDAGVESPVAAIPAEQESRVVGGFAAVDLRRGTMIPPTAVTRDLRPSAGEDLVPVAMKQSRLPARGLAPGDRVIVVATADGGGDAPNGKVSAQTPPPGQVSATVDRVTGTPDADGQIVVDLLVPSADGPQLAQHAADGKVALVLASRGQ
ncbi:SAF domain-containing protein [Actinomadura rupiterrae]|uniref:SAF domain-containing protein n=1 Tax=Actinomadura rupiterrae TaxID=559627 RepID=UPI0020A51E61|nr:SAF domain-containing protein [Actinomadura rupiterrae]MCP2337517.1 Flp pilus assembly protein CpaB [Actinomadura rupiterrae]